MAAQDKHINFGAADFQRYHAGEMTATEMHALEKAALEDPFLADALEGYQFTSTAEADLEEISAKIPPAEKQKDNAKVFTLNQWLRIAAMLVLVAGVVFIGLKINNKKAVDGPLALNDNKLSPVKDAIVAPSGPATSVEQKDSLTFASIEKPHSNESNALSQLRIESEKNEQLKAFSEAGKKEYRDIVKENNDDRNSWMKTSPSPAPATSMKDFDVTPLNKFVLKGKVTDEAGSPVSFANIFTEDKKQAVVTDAAGYFNLPVKDSLILANVSATGYSFLNQSLNSNQFQNIVLQRSSSNLEEVVVTSLGTQRQRKDVGYSTSKVNKAGISAAENVLEGKVSGVQITGTVPQKGIVMYDKYVADSLKRPLSPDSNKLVRGSVVLSFNVNKRGQPTHIKVDTSLCPDCDKEAIRLLENGPKLSPSRGKRVQTLITF